MLRIMFVCDPCGIVCFCVTYCSLAYADYCVLYHVLRPALGGSMWLIVHALLFNLSLFMMTFAHLKAVLTDPGHVPLPKDNNQLMHQERDASGYNRSSTRRAKLTAADNNEWTVCDKCETYRPPRAHHCRTCQRCVKRMDHHCPWVNNCVGERNQKFFILFLLYTAVATMYGLALAVGTWGLKRCVTGDCTRAYLNSERPLHLGLLCGICGLFCLFVTCILYDQIYSTIYDITPIEQLRHSSLMYTRRAGCGQALRNVCGMDSAVKWFLPWVNPNLDDTADGGPPADYARHPQTHNV